MSSIAAVTLLSVVVLVTICNAREITRVESETESPVNTKATVAPGDSKGTTNDTESVKERAIDRQVKELNKLKCKPRREKVYTLDYLPPESEYMDYPHIFPQVLSVKKCDPNCTYCQEKKRMGKRDTEICTAIKQKEKEFTIRAIGYGKREYFKVKIPTDQKCECKPKFD